jgi:hypothetical protein
MGSTKYPMIEKQGYEVSTFEHTRIVHAARVAVEANEAWITEAMREALDDLELALRTELTPAGAPAHGMVSLDAITEAETVVEETYLTARAAHDATKPN